MKRLAIQLLTCCLALGLCGASARSAPRRRSLWSRTGPGGWWRSTAACATPVPTRAMVGGPRSAPSSRSAAASSPKAMLGADPASSDDLWAEPDAPSVLPRRLGADPQKAAHLCAIGSKVGAAALRGRTSYASLMVGHRLPGAMSIPRGRQVAHAGSTSRPVRGQANCAPAQTAPRQPRDNVDARGRPGPEKRSNSCRPTAGETRNRGRGTVVRDRPRTVIRRGGRQRVVAAAARSNAARNAGRPLRQS